MSSDNTKKTKGKPRGKPFPAGVSPNPGGRPKLTDAQRLAREAKACAQPEAVAYLVAVMRDAGEATKERLVAAKALLEGLDAVRLEHNLANPFSGLTPEQLLAMASRG